MVTENTSFVNRKYSVKDTLTSYFTGDTIRKMRASDADGVKENPKDLLPLALAYADDMVISHFLKNKFLVDTILYDDYIAYFVKFGNIEEVYLSFMHCEDEYCLSLDPKYAYDLVTFWKKKGYKAYIIRNCVSVEQYHDSDHFRFTYRLSEDQGTDFLLPVPVEGKYIFVRDKEFYWEHSNVLLLSAIKSGRISDYECILADDSVIARCPWRSEWARSSGKYEKVEPFVTGVTAIKEYFDSKSSFFIAYIKRRKSIAYSTYLVSGDNKYVLFVGLSNQIIQLVEEPITDDEDVIPVPTEQLPRILSKPAITSVRSLDIPTMHSYAVQVSFENGCIKNYYISKLTEADLPKSVFVDGYQFDQSILDSAELICDHQGERVVFSNGYSIPSHLLYYRGVTQLVPEKIPGTVFENECIKIDGIYRLPLHIRRGTFYETYQPYFGEYYGMGYTFLDEHGNRITDYSGLYIDTRGTGERNIYCTNSESSRLVGYRKKDGNWLVPPIFDKGEDFEYEHCVKVKKGDKEYILNEMGELIDFPYEVKLEYFSDGLCAFSTGKYEGEFTYPDEEYFDELSAGNWGFIDKYGKIVIEPQYVFTSGYHHISNRAFVAKVIDGETLWGLIDEKGNEVIPCIYPNLATHSGTAVNFQRDKHGDYGIMDFDGNVIMEPRFYGIYEYDEKHGLVAFFEDWSEGHKVGVARVSDGEIIVPTKYSYIGFEDNYIECEKDYWPDGEYSCDYYDYDGNKLPDNIYLKGWKCDKGYGSWRNGKCGAIDENNNIIVPFVFDDSSHINYYLRGYVVTGTKGKYGLATRDGKELLPECYQGITITDSFIIASNKNDHNWSITDELYLLDGTPVFKDTCRRIYIKENSLTRETPLGVEHYRIVKK